MTVIDRIEVELAGDMAPLRRALEEAERATAESGTRLARAAAGGESAFAGLGEAAGDAARTIETALVGALSGAEIDWNRILARMALRLSDLVLQASLGDPLKQILGSGSGRPPGSAGTGGMDGLASLIGSLFGGFRAAGGAVEGGRAYVVGEQGPELFVPGAAGTVLPVPAGRPPPVVINVTTPDAESFRRARGPVAAAMARALAAGRRFS